MPTINTVEPILEETLDHPEMLRAFETYLDKEFSSENLAFYRALQDLEDKAGDPSVSDAQLRQQVAGIYEHYVKPDSTRQVNISDVQVKAMVYELENLSTMNRQEMVDTLGESKKEINALFRRDSFRRFAETPEFKVAAEKVHSNSEVEKQIADLQEKRRQALLNPSVKDRFKSSVGSKTKEQELAQQINTLQGELEASRSLKAIDVPQVNMQTVTASISQSAGAHHASDAQKAAKEAADKQAKALKESQEKAKEQDVAKEKDVAEENLAPLAPPRVGSPSVSSEPGDLDEPEVPQFQIGDDGWPELEDPDGVELQPQIQNQNQNEFEDMSQEDLSQLDVGEGRGRGARVEEVDLGQMRGRSKGMDAIEVDVGQTRGRSRVIPEPPEAPKPTVRDSLGRRDSQPKQGQGGPKVS